MTLRAALKLRGRHDDAGKIVTKLAKSDDAGNIMLVRATPWSILDPRHNKAGCAVMMQACEQNCDHTKLERRRAHARAPTQARADLAGETRQLRRWKRRALTLIFGRMVTWRLRHQQNP